MMEKLVARGEEIARDAQERAISRMAESVGRKLQAAAIELVQGGFTVRDLHLLDRWLDDPELRFMGRIEK